MTLGQVLGGPVSLERDGRIGTLRAVEPVTIHHFAATPGQPDQGVGGFAPPSSAFMMFRGDPISVAGVASVPADPLGGR